MALDLSSAWSSPRGWKLIMLTVLGLTLLLLVPLYQLSDHDNSGIYSHLTKYLGHEGTGSSDPADGAYNNNTESSDIIADGDFNSTEGIDSNLNETDDNKSTDHLDDNSQSESDGTDAEGKEDDNKPEGDETKSTEESVPTEETTPTEESTPEDDENKSDGDENKSEEENKSEDEAHETKTAEGSTSTEETIPVEGNNPDDGENKSDGDENKSEEESKSEGDDGNDDDSKDETPEENINNPSVYPESRDRPCDGFPNMDKILLVMKTGATEAYTKLPTQLLTGLQCIDDFLLFSDLVSGKIPND